MKTKKGEDSPGIVTCSNPLFFSRPDWHPAGEWIAAEHADSVDTNKDGKKDTWFVGIWLVHAQSGQTQPLLPFGDAPDWNPDGTHLAVHAGGGIYTVEIASLHPARYDTSSINLITDFEAPAFYPTWSGDGEWIAFDTNYEDPNGTYGIVKKKLNENTIIDITKYRSQGAWRQGDWSKKNDIIAFRKYDVEVDWNIFIANSEGNSLKRLTTKGENYHPKFSPDSRRIIYEHWDGINKSIRIMNSDGDGKKVLAKNWASDMAWSPDGKKIVYVFSNQYYDRPGNGQLWIMNADGSNKKQLTNFKPTMP
ncbi:PD40 domain-containing protein [Gracilimonas tropica]|uniref:PD40 domain-containing protein n=1 Tax=Gracilimonas tropica TaxID=454600 RepID=UPI0014612FED|nr:PD40 domain-containing protein [Gracilimonas tropica]